MAEHSMETRQPQLILDIGTRSVVGIAGHREGELFVVDAWQLQPHTRRAMIDGQIEDIEQVAAVAGQVVRAIEESLQCQFSCVSVAAAGRALKTRRAKASVTLPQGKIITAQDVYNLENEAINQARALLADENADTAYYCVGHSAVQYRLDDYPFTTLLGHQGSHAETEVIATFLPAEVVESLRRCMALLNLDIDTLTLEPIAAMRAVIPQDIRLLNLALVDIGAGTSDIALSADGSVSGYTMATVAGDEITEAIIRQYLVDFSTAERLKTAISAGGPFKYTDILGFEYELSADDLLATIEPAVDRLAQVIADKILESNAGAPVAVFLVGGGSKTPNLAEKIATRLDLDTKRVAAANTRFAGRVLDANAALDDPEFATPVGIALVAADNAQVEVASVTVNNKRVRLFVPGATTVMDALLASGYTYTDLMGRNGRSLTFTLNGRQLVLRGGMYTIAVITMNGKPAMLTSPVVTGDVIEIEPAQPGKDAAATIANYAEGQLPLQVQLNGVSLYAGLIARVNGTLAMIDTAILNHDVIDIQIIRTVGELCHAAQIETSGAELTINGKPATPDTMLNQGDVVTCAAPGSSPAPPVVSNDFSVAPASQTAYDANSKAPSKAAAAQSDIADIAAGASRTQSTNQPAATADTAARELNTHNNTKVAPAQTNATAEMPRAQNTNQSAAMQAGTAAGEHDTSNNAKVAPAQTNATAEMPRTLSTNQPAATQADTATKPSFRNTSDIATAPTAPVNAAEPQPAGSLRHTQTDKAEEPRLKNSDEHNSIAPSGQHRTAVSAENTAHTSGQSLRIELNGKTVVLPPKPDGAPHCLFDMLTLVDIDPANPKGLVKVMVNHKEAPYMQQLANGDIVEIGWDTLP